jgi:hypothetical protein
MQLILKKNFLDIFGPSYWNIIHLEAFKITLLRYTPNTDYAHIKFRTENYFGFLLYIINNMICSCRNHATRIILCNNFDIDNDDLFLWTIKLHNSVNMRLEKPQETFENILKEYKTYIIKQ